MFLKADFSYLHAQHMTENRFREVTYSQLIDPDNVFGSLYRMRATYLYTSVAKKTFVKTWQARRGSAAARLPEAVKFDRFHAFGVPATPHIALVFTKTEHLSSDFLRYSCHFCPGDEVWLVLPKMDGNIHQNPIVRMEEPLVPVADSLIFATDVSPPRNVEHGSYVYFDFKAKDIEVLQASPVDNTCSGVLCDGQFESATCGCTKAPSKRHWTLKITFSCPPMDQVANDELSIASNRLTRLLIDEEVRCWPASYPRVDPFDIYGDVSSNKQLVFEEIRLLANLKLS